MIEWIDTVGAIGADVVYALLMAGMWLAITAVYVPGTGFPEAAAAIALLLAGIGLFALPTSIVGILMLAIALGCFLTLIYFRKQWLLIVIGMVFQTLGSIFLFREGMYPSVWVIVLANAAALAFHQLILMPGLRIQGQAEHMGDKALIGERGQVINTIDPLGTIRLHGEIWVAHSDQVIEARTWVRVVGRRGLELDVVPSERPVTYVE